MNGKNSSIIDNVMPSWNIHLEAGNRLADKLRLKDKDRKAFLLGCILPDINQGYINSVQVTKPHAETHYNFNKKSSRNFYDENQAQIEARDPIFLGYLFHLYTDGRFNYDFYSSVKKYDEYKNLTHPQKAQIKHRDFYIFDSHFHHYLGIDNRETAAELTILANRIRPVELVSEDLEVVEKILTDDVLNDSVRGKPYRFYTAERLEQLLKDTVDSFINDYLKGDQNA